MGRTTTPLRSDLLFEVMPPAAEYRELQRRLETIHQPEVLQQILLALFDAADTAVILDLVRNLENNPGPDE